MPEDLRLPIGGEWIETGQWDDVVNPFDGGVVARVPLAGHEHLERATAAAVRAFGVTRELATHRRTAILEGIVAGIRARADELAETIARESGKPLQYARGEVERAQVTFGLAVDEARAAAGEVLPVDLQARTEGYASLYQRFPIGPVSAIAPFNFPLNLVAHKLAPAIAAGCPVVLKPAMQAPITSLKLAEICYEADLPPEAFQIVHSMPDVAERLATDARYKLLSFTGSARVGWHLKSVAGRKKVVLELGGNAGAIVHEDADVDRVADRCAVGAFAAAGQVCIKVQRLLVHRSVYDRFVARFLEAARALPAGDPLDAGTVVGPMIDSAAADRVQAWVAEAVDAGAERLLDGGRDGAVLLPTVLAGTSPEMRVEREEVFGPVVTLRPYDDFGDALEQLNAGPYGLQAGVFTKDIDRIWRAFRTLEVGGVIANDYPMLRVDNYPYGGVKESGFGREGVKFAMADMTELRALVLRLG